ncbi:hypothetical protein C8J56DRAFT_294908 [Mycena floridula]|nr:hypothetical protein C8J56DRAFT_294908 [Mycena floridula]
MFLCFSVRLEIDDVENITHLNVLNDLSPIMLHPIFYHYFQFPLQYARTLALQEKIHKIQLLQRRNSLHKDVLLLLEHQPVYTSGRRQTEDSVETERTRLTRLGADFVTTERGGQLTYHGPGQIIGYPLLDLSRWNPTMSIRDYICHMQKTLQLHLLEGHGIEAAPSDHTGVFLDSTTKIGSIGVQVRHRFTSHGFSLNLTNEPLPRFNEIVACGLVDVKAASLETAKGKQVVVQDEIPGLISRFGQEFGRDMVQLDIEEDDETSEAIRTAEKEMK